MQYEAKCSKRFLMVFFFVWSETQQRIPALIPIMNKREKKKENLAGDHSFLGQYFGAYHRSSGGGGSTGNWARTPTAPSRWACSRPRSWMSPGRPRRSRCRVAGRWPVCPGPRSDPTATAELWDEKKNPKTRTIKHTNTPRLTCN